MGVILCVPRLTVLFNDLFYSWILSKDSVAGFLPMILCKNPFRNLKRILLREGFAMAAVISMAAATGWRAPTV